MCNKSTIEMSDWLMQNYGMKYSTYRRKPKRRRDELRSQFQVETGCIIEMPTICQVLTEDEIDEIIASAGIPALE